MIVLHNVFGMSYSNHNQSLAPGGCDAKWRPVHTRNEPGADLYFSTC